MTRLSEFDSIHLIISSTISFPAFRFQHSNFHSLHMNSTDPIFTSLRTIESTANPDGSSTSHVVVRCTLADIARATGLRVEDTAFAMNECGLLVRKQKIDNPDEEHGNAEENGHGEEEEIIVISREMVELVAKERNVKKMCMDLAHVLL